MGVFLCIFCSKCYYTSSEVIFVRVGRESCWRRFKRRNEDRLNISLTWIYERDHIDPAPMATFCSDLGDESGLCWGRERIIVIFDTQPYHKHRTRLNIALRRTCFCFSFLLHWFSRIYFVSFSLFILYSCAGLLGLTVVYGRCGVVWRKLVNTVVWHTQRRAASEQMYCWYWLRRHPYWQGYVSCGQMWGGGTHGFIKLQWASTSRTYHYTNLCDSCLTLPFHEMTNVCTNSKMQNACIDFWWKKISSLLVIFSSQMFRNFVWLEGRHLTGWDNGCPWQPSEPKSSQHVYFSIIYM